MMLRRDVIPFILSIFYLRILIPAACHMLPSLSGA